MYIVHIYIYIYIYWEVTPEPHQAEHTTKPYTVPHGPQVHRDQPSA